MPSPRDAEAKRSAGGRHLRWGHAEAAPVQGAPCWGEPQEKKKKCRSKAECFFFSCGGQSPGPSGGTHDHPGPTVHAKRGCSHVGLG